MDDKFKKLYQENPELPAFALAPNFDSEREMNSYIDYAMARKEGQSHTEAMESLKKLQPSRDKEAQLFTRLAAERERSPDSRQRAARARSLRETATGGPTSV